MRAASTFFIFAFLPRAALAAACCLGGSVKSFISLQRLQTYEVGVSTTARDVYGRYNLFGELDEAEPNQTLTLALGAGARLTQDLQAFLILPWVYRTEGGGRTDGTRAGVGDAVVGAQYTLIESLFRDDWYPTVTLTGGAKLPTGSTETKLGGKMVPGTGNGVWEPFFGIGLEKPLGFPTISLKATYTGRTGDRGAALGDMIELTGTVTAVLHQRFSLAAGATQAWILKDGQRVASLFLTPTYYITRFWSVAAAAEVTLPMDGFGIGQQAMRAFTVTTRYGFY